jgi:hypothetical protein
VIDSLILTKTQNIMQFSPNSHICKIIHLKTIKSILQTQTDTHPEIKLL